LGITPPAIKSVLGSLFLAHSRRFVQNESHTRFSRVGLPSSITATSFAWLVREAGFGFIVVEGQGEKKIIAVGRRALWRANAGSGGNAT
jgi:hypothetical protein